MKSDLQKFASKHGLELITPRDLRISETHKHVIWASAKNLALQDLEIKNSKPFVIDYMDFKKIMAKSSLLKKCFSKKDVGKKVVDMTAGYCIDALEISFLGYSVTAIEKKSWLYEFTNQCLQNSKHKDLQPSINRIDFLNGDSLDFIKNTRIMRLSILIKCLNKKMMQEPKKKYNF